jgi:hypothetical protein
MLQVQKALRLMFFSTAARQYARSCTHARCVLLAVQSTHIDLGLQATAEPGGHNLETSERNFTGLLLSIHSVCGKSAVHPSSMGTRDSLKLGGKMSSVQVTLAPYNTCISGTFVSPFGPVPVCAPARQDEHQQTTVVTPDDSLPRMSAAS